MNDYTGMLEAGMEGASRRQDAIANNIANADTPGYKREDVEFKGVLAEKAGSDAGDRGGLRRTNPRHLPGRRGKLSGSNFVHFREEGTSLRHDENNVDIEREMAEMAKNELYFNTVAQQLDAKFNNLQTVMDRSG